MQKGMTAIANVPSREVLLGKLLGSIQSPITNFARVINQIAEQQGAHKPLPTIRCKSKPHRQHDTKYLINQEEIKMAKLTTAEFIDAIKELSVLELNDLVKACEEEFGVSAAAGVVVAAAGAAQQAAEEKD